MRCPNCRKEISEDEYVVNWRGCTDCLSKSYENYLMEKHMIEKKVINLQIEVTAANDDKNGCILSGKVNHEGNPVLLTHIPANSPRFGLDKDSLSTRIARQVGALISELLEEMPFPEPSCMQEEGLPPDQQGV